MSSVHQIVRHPEFRLGMRDMLSVAPGLAAWGMMTGVAMVKSGMSLAESIAMTLLVYAGSSQLAAIPLIAAGAPVLVIWATGFCVNLRFVVFSAHMRPYLMHLPRRWRLLAGYVTADISYVMFTKRFHQPPQTAAERQTQLAYLMGGCATNWSSWQVASLLGIFLAHSVPAHWGLGFAGILALLGVGCSLASSRLRLVSAGLAGTAAVAAFALPFKLNIVVAIAAAVALCLLLEKTPPFRREATR
ncbi:AzlC family ABC transporter permease [Rhodoferax sp. BAB1]|uniref:AzlC family ABC transporter permease n=1 Tax=Rhodoferax sp. BAB1 TaxID=2741720 RepID=UPI0015768035|nr:AzlC family ABC transporter permease [Rhodoferax sp. BAB1]QKO23500.1 AzlC family ABC transporter permease [Rhodoferax sp. BAB1]